MKRKRRKMSVGRDKIKEGKGDVSKEKKTEKRRMRKKKEQEKKRKKEGREDKIKKKGDVGKGKWLE